LFQDNFSVVQLLIQETQACVKVIICVQKNCTNFWSYQQFKTVFILLFDYSLNYVFMGLVSRGCLSMSGNRVDACVLTCQWDILWEVLVISNWEIFSHRNTLLRFVREKVLGTGEIIHSKQKGRKWVLAMRPRLFSFILYFCFPTHCKNYSLFFMSSSMFNSNLRVDFEG
jgi:hypothetical protein